jgi:hypothetical protein
MGLRLLPLAAGLAATSAQADVASPVAALHAPGWVIATIAIVLFLAVIVILSRFVRNNPGDHNDDGGGLFGPP